MLLLLLALFSLIADGALGRLAFGVWRLADRLVATFETVNHKLDANQSKSQKNCS